MITKDILDFLAIESTFYNSHIHGIHHWRTVERNGLYLCQFNNADPSVISYFAYFHDCKRENENSDNEHGPRATEFLKLHRSKIDLTDGQFKQLCRACSGHTFGSLATDITIATCWDADRLDLDRVGVVRNPKYFTAKEAKRIVIEDDNKVLRDFGVRTQEISARFSLPRKIFQGLKPNRL